LLARGAIVPASLKGALTERPQSESAMSAFIRTVRRLAADLLKVGESRVWIDPDHLDKAEAAITREDVRRLIKEGVIRKEPPSTPSRGRWRVRHEQRKKGRRRGPGRRKGPRISEKELWIARVRAQRRFLKLAKERGLIDAKTYRRLRSLVKGGAFKSVSQLKEHVKSIASQKLEGQGGASG